MVNKLEVRAADTDDPSRDCRSLYESDDSLDASDLQPDDVVADRNVPPLPQQEQTKGGPPKSPSTKGTLPSSTPQPAGAEQPLKQAQQAAAGGLDEIRRTFDKLDRNGDGIVNIREFIISIRKDPELGAWLGLGTLGGKGVKQEEGR
jgi:type IV secretory pathway VirB10-like protein